MLLGALSAEDVRFRDVAVDGGTLSVALAGDQALPGLPVILLHGWTLDHRMWAPQVAGLGRAFTLVMPDRRGCGRSTAPPDGAREAQDVIAIADALGFARFAVVGLSQGAVVALDLARRYPARLNGVAVSGAPLPALVPRKEAIDLNHYRTLAAAGEMAAMRADWAQHPLMQGRTPAARRLLAAMLADYDGRDLRAATEPPGLPSEQLSALAVPVLAIAGEHDTPWRRACAAALGQTVPRGLHALVQQAGHLANADNPARFNALIEAFFRSVTDPTKKA